MSHSAMLAEKRAGVQAEIDAMASTIEAEARAFSADEQTKFDGLIADARSIDADLERHAQADEARAAASATAAKFGVGLAKVTEPQVYRKGGDNSYFRDLSAAMVKGDRQAIERLSRNDLMVADEKRAINTTFGSGGEFVPPLWLENQWIAFARAGRPFADVVTKQELPAGTDSINLPKISGGSSSPAYPTQGGSLNVTDITTSTVTGPVVTLAGGQVVSLQLLEQSPVNLDEILLQDLAASYAAQLDSNVLSGTGATGIMTGVLSLTNSNSVTFTSTQPTLGGLYSKIAGGIQAIHSARFMPPTHIVMHPRRWAFCLAALDGNNRPLIVPDAYGPFNTVGNLGTPIASQGIVGSIQGVPVLVDANIPTNLGTGTNQDVVIVAKADDLYLYEGTPRAEALAQTYGSTLQVLVRLYNYAAFIGNRYPQSVSVISGSGLVAPSF